MNYEVNLLNSIIEVNDLPFFIDQHIDQCFSEHDDVWSFIKEFNNEYGRTPSKDVIKENLKNFKFF